MALLDRVIDFEKAASAFGLAWETTEQIMAQIQSECLEVRTHLQTDPALVNHAELQEEIGDLLHAVFSLCVFCQFDPSETLGLSLDKFEQRLNAVKAIAQERGLTHLKGYPFDELMLIWQQAKTRAVKKS